MRAGKALIGGTGRKLLLSGALLGMVASIAGMASYASFTSTTSASQAVASGTVNVALGAAGGVDNRLTIGATNLAAGDTIDRQIKVSNSGSIDLASATVTTSATTSSLLDTDATNGLQLQIDKCSVAWTETGSGPYTYTCGGTTTSVLASRAVIGSAISLSGLNAMTAGGSDYLRVRLTLPTAANNTFQGKSSTILYTFDATQRAATAK
jgi:predicted ribosomally synthesized peptide with SipW-like signal peptide